MGSHGMEPHGCARSQPVPFGGETRLLLGGSTPRTPQPFLIFNPLSRASLMLGILTDPVFFFPWILYFLQPVQRPVGLKTTSLHPQISFTLPLIVSQITDAQGFSATHLSLFLGTVWLFLAGDGHDLASCRAGMIELDRDPAKIQAKHPQGNNLFVRREQCRAVASESRAPVGSCSSRSCIPRGMRRQ